MDIFNLLDKNNGTFTEGLDKNANGSTHWANVSEEDSGVIHIFGGGMQLFFSVANISTIVLSFIAAIAHIPLLAVLQLFFSVANISTIVLSFIAAIAHIPLLAVLRRCRKMPKSLSLLSMNFAVCSLLYFSSLMALMTTFLSWRHAYTQTFYVFRSLYLTSVFTTTVISIGGLALERYIRVMYPLYSPRILKTSCVVGYIALTWTIGFVIPVSVLIYDLIKTCGLVWSDCIPNQVRSITRIIFFFTITSCSFFICFSCFKISRTIRSLRLHPFKPQLVSEKCTEGRSSIPGPNQTSAPPRLKSSKGFKTIGYTVKIMLTYIIFHTPLIMNAIIFEVFPNLQTILARAIVLNLSFCCTLASFFISLHFYIWKFKECKLVFLQLLCTWNKRYERQTQDLKMDVYDIQTA